MKDIFAIISIIILLGATYFLHDYVNPKPIQNTIWISKRISNGNRLDTVKIVESTNSYVRTKSAIYGLTSHYRTKEFQLNYERCLECETMTIPYLSE